jgi:hypothetical protein
MSQGAAPANSNQLEGSGTGVATTEPETVKRTESTPGVKKGPEDGNSVAVKIFELAWKLVPSARAKRVWLSWALKSASEKVAESRTNCWENPGPMSAKDMELGVPDSVRVSVGLEKVRAEETGKSGGSLKASVELFTVKASMAPGISTSNDSTPTFNESALAAAEPISTNTSASKARDRNELVIHFGWGGNRLGVPKSGSFISPVDADGRRVALMQPRSEVKSISIGPSQGRTRTLHANILLYWRAIP